MMKMRGERTRGSIDIAGGEKTTRGRIVRANLDGEGNAIIATRALGQMIQRQRLICRRGLTSKDAGGLMIPWRISWRAFCRACFDSPLLAGSSSSRFTLFTWCEPRAFLVFIGFSFFSLYVMTTLMIPYGSIHTDEFTEMISRPWHFSSTNIVITSLKKFPCDELYLIATPAISSYIISLQYRYQTCFPMSRMLSISIYQDKWANSCFTNL